MKCNRLASYRPQYPIETDRVENDIMVWLVVVSCQFLNYLFLPIGLESTPCIESRTILSNTNTNILLHEYVLLTQDKSPRSTCTGSLERETNNIFYDCLLSVLPPFVSHDTILTIFRSNILYVLRLHFTFTILRLLG